MQLIHNKIAPCGGLVHLTLDKREQFLFAVSFSDASILMYHLNDDGCILDLCCEIIHSSKNLKPIPKDNAHAHHVCLSPDESYLCVCDLGLDTVAIYQVDYKNGNLLKREDLNVELPSGCGPRHMTFHPNCNYAYVLTELSSEVYVLKYDKDSVFKIIQRTSTLMNSTSESYAGAIRISKDGKFLYTSNRGDDSIAIFIINEDGTVSLNATVNTHGKHPRDFILCNNDQLLICANKDTDNITIFRRDIDTGSIIFMEEITGISMPVSLLVEDYE
jgi:6-phosphogluconolactonase